MADQSSHLENETSRSTEKWEPSESNLHRSEGKVDNIEPQENTLFVQCPVHKTPSTASEHITYTVQVQDLRETASFGTFAVELYQGPEPEVLEETLQSFVEAIRKKYTDPDIENITEAVGNVVYVPKSGPVKMTASGNIVLPRQVSMSGCEISVAGDTALIQRMCQKVRELDLMENNISCWHEVVSIIEYIPHLTFLNLTKNHLTSDLPDLRGRRLPSLTHLVLNDTMITWDSLLQLLEAFPSVEELHLSLNGFESVDIPITITSATSAPSSWSSVTSVVNYPGLRKLFFIGNKVTRWREINKLGAFFPNLDFLLLSETDISTLDGADEVNDCFPNLQTLGLNRTLLASWEEIEKLRLFPSLTDVRLNAIPFLDEIPEQFRRQHTIALLPNITILNGSSVKEIDREDAERAYIRLYMDKKDKNKRYYELEKQHGKLDPLVNIQLKPKLQVNLKVNVEGPNQEPIKSEYMDIELNQTVRDLKKSLSNVAGCSAAKFQLFYLDRQSQFGPDRLQYMDRKVFSYNMSDGDEIIIALKE